MIRGTSGWFITAGMWAEFSPGCSRVQVNTTLNQGTVGHSLALIKLWYHEMSWSKAYIKIFSTKLNTHTPAHEHAHTHIKNTCMRFYKRKNKNKIVMLIDDKTGPKDIIQYYLCFVMVLEVCCGSLLCLLRLFLIVGFFFFKGFIHSFNTGANS